MATETAVRTDVFMAPAQVAKPNVSAKETKMKRTGISEKHQANHPSYLTMIKAALMALNDKKGSSRGAILKYICQNFQLGENLIIINAHLRQALKRAVKSGYLKQPTGIGASGSFMLGATKHIKNPEKKHKKVAKKAGIGTKQKAKGKRANAGKKGGTKKHRKGGVKKHQSAAVTEVPTVNAAAAMPQAQPPVGVVHDKVASKASGMKGKTTKKGMKGKKKGAKKTPMAKSMKRGRKLSPPKPKVAAVA